MCLSIFLSTYLSDLEICFAPQQCALFRHLIFQSGAHMMCCVLFDVDMRFAPHQRFSTCIPPKVAQNSHVFLHFDLDMCFAPQRRALSDIHPFKVVRDVFNILTLKCASRHSRVQFFDTGTSKSGPNMVCFLHLGLEMCFAPRGRAIIDFSSGHMAPHPPL